MDTGSEIISPPYLQLKAIDKSFGVTKALSGMNLEIYPGEIIGLVGPNGAGKSTLMKIITGVLEPTQGAIQFDGNHYENKKYDANKAKEYGITCAYQELSLCSNLKVYENFLVSHLDHKPISGFGWRKKGKLDSLKALEAVFPNHGINVNLLVNDLSLSQKQMVEISRAASFEGLRILILDEPTSSLTVDRINQLHDSMRQLAERGVSIIYISHKLDEIEKICDRVVVMKSGSACWEGHRSETSMHALVEILGGQIKSDSRSTQDFANEPFLVEINQFSNDNLKNINLYIKKGELVGISGLDGSGQKDLISAILKASKTKTHKNRAVKLYSKVSYVSGDRQNEGIFPLWNIADNTLISSLEQTTQLGLIRKQRFAKLANFWYKKLKFKANGVDDAITNLSGGNQQKALLARGLAADADLILLNDPTCGVDIETKQEIYRLLSEATKSGKAVLLHSTEDLEMELCDRVYIMHEGTIARELSGTQVTVKNIIQTSFEEKLNKKNSTEIREKKTSKFNLSKIITARSFLAIAALILIFTIATKLNSKILSYNGIELLYSSAVPLVFMALGQMFMVISGGIDMGNGMSLGLMNVIIAYTVISNPAMGLLSIILFVLGYALLAAIIHITKIPGIVITMGASFIWLGIALIVSPTPGGKAPEWLISFFRFRFPFIPMPIVISIAAALISYWIVRKSKYGMIINGVGNNPVAIERAGWSLLAAKMTAYAISGFMVVIGGFMLTAISNSGDCNASRSYNMLSIATIVLGGCEFVGGISSPIGVTAAALAISSISFLLTFMNVDSNLQSAVTGLILIIALALKLLSGKLEAKNEH